MKRKQLLAATISIATLALFQVPLVAAAEVAKKIDLAHAKQIVDTVCAACHGADGNSVASANPNLAGQGADYITRQLQHFKSGVRPNAVMAALVAGLTPDDMVALGLYFSQQKPKGGTARDPALVKSGQALFRGGLAATGLPACSSCHSPNGAGIPKNYPRLAGQHAEYTLRATQGIQGRRTRRRQGRQGRPGPDHGRRRAKNDRRADEGGRGLQRGIPIATG